MEACSSQQEIFDGIKDLESDDKLLPSPNEIKVSEDAPGKAPTRRRKLLAIEKNGLKVLQQKSLK